jgi:hypothetical protein
VLWLSLLVKGLELRQDIEAIEEATQNMAVGVTSAGSVR